MASNEAVLVEIAVSKLYYLQLITIGIRTFLNEHFKLVQFHLKPSFFTESQGHSMIQKSVPPFKKLN